MYFLFPDPIPAVLHYLCWHQAAHCPGYYTHLLCALTTFFIISSFFLIALLSSVCKQFLRLLFFHRILYLSMTVFVKPISVDNHASPVCKLTFSFLIGSVTLFFFSPWSLAHFNIFFYGSLHKRFIISDFTHFCCIKLLLSCGAVCLWLCEKMEAEFQIRICSLFFIFGK